MRMIFYNYYATTEYLVREILVKKKDKIINTVIAVSFPFLLTINNASASTAKVNELCIEGKSDCTFVLLSPVNGSETKNTPVSANQTKEHPAIRGGNINDNEKLIRVNKNRANKQFSPFSTFKVANSLIGLDTQTIKNAEQKLTFDKKKYPVQAWWPSVWKLPKYDLNTAFKFSMVAVYRQLAMDIGQQKMQSYINNFSYGNQNISSGLDNFWLNGSLQITAVEQVRFLQKMVQGQLAVKQTSVDVLKSVMLVERTPNYSLYAKTGAGKAFPNEKGNKAMLGWYIGFVETAQGVHYFAFNFTRDSYKEMKTSRIKMAMNHLKAAGVI